MCEQASVLYTLPLALVSIHIHVVFGFAFGFVRLGPIIDVLGPMFGFLGNLFYFLGPIVHLLGRFVGFGKPFLLCKTKQNKTDKTSQTDATSDSKLDSELGSKRQDGQSMGAGGDREASFNKKGG